MADLNTLNDTPVELRFGEKNGKIVHIAEVQSGLECGCVCPACQTPLIARKGDIRTHHFAHYQENGSDGCIETALHRYAKQVIYDHHKVTVPEDFIKAQAFDQQGHSHQRQLLITRALIEFEKVELEVFKESFRADATGFPYENQCLDIEIRVTHEVDDEKREKAKAASSCMMEIDLSAIERDASPEQIAEAVLNSAPRLWVHNPIHSAKQAELQSEVNRMVMEANQKMMEEAEKNKITLSPQNPNNFILLGFKVAHGYSPRYQKNFELSKVYTSRPVVSTNTRNFTVTESGGFEMEEFDLDESCIKKLESFSFPVEVSFVMGNKLHGRKFVPVVLDVKPI